MKKRLASLLLSAALLLCAVPVASAAGFSDISDPETAVAAAALQGLGVVSGGSDGSFQPNGTLTRAQVCVMAVNMMGLSGQVGTYARRTLFSDVAPTAWYNGYVNLAYSQGIISGYGNGRFGPDDVITYGQLCTILLRMLGYTTQEIGSVWPADYTAFAQRLELTGGLSLGDDQSVTRGQAAILFYRTLNTAVSGSDRAFYRSISGLSSTGQAILLDADASYGGSSGLLMAYTLEEGVIYYHQSRPQSGALAGTLGQLLFDASGKVMGFIPDSSSYEDLTISSATASTLKDTAGRSLRVPADTTVIALGETYPYHNGGYLQLNAQAGSAVRVFYDGDGSILCLYLAGETSSTAQAVVADSTQVLSALENGLGLTGRTYSITKNGAAADQTALARYDVGYYDAASATLRVSDYRVEGYLTAASPSVTAAQTVTLSGASIPVLECAWDSLSCFALGDKVTALLTDDGKAAAFLAPSKVDTEMLGVLDVQGKSVTLVGSGITLTAGDVDYARGLPGSLVRVKAGDVDELSCTAPASGSLSLDVAGRTLGQYPLSPACAIYEWAGSGYVWDLEGSRGAASSSLNAISWTGTLSSSYVSYYHLNSAGQVDVLLLEDVTGNLYTYGEITAYTGTEGISIGDRDNYNDAAAVTNAGGTSEKYLCTIQIRSGSYVGIAAGKGLNDTPRVERVLALEKHTGAGSQDFYRADGSWYVELDGVEYPVSDSVQVHLSAAGAWLSGEDGLMTALADGYPLTLYADRAAGAGGQIRVVSAG